MYSDFHSKMQATTDIDNKGKSAGDSDESIQLHSDEILRRLAWCVQQGPEYWPANQSVHLAPGDDRNFVHGIPPWNGDGSPNTAGIPDAHSSVLGLLPSGGQLICDSAYGWECRECMKWVNMMPRAFEGVDEPAWWWWCADCRSKVSSTSIKQKRNLRIAASCQKIKFGKINQK